MHIKIGDTIDDGVGYPMMVIVPARDKWNIADMPADHYRDAQIPEDSDEKEIEACMDKGMEGIVETGTTEARWVRYEKAQRRKRIAYAIGMCHVLRDLVVVPNPTPMGLVVYWRRYDRAIHKLTIKLLEEWEAKDEN